MKRTLATLACYLLLPPLASLALSTTATDSTKFNKRLREVRISKKGKVRNALSANPRQSISVDEMAVFGANNVSDALKHVAGVNLRDYGGAGGMKTVDIRGLGSQFTAVNYDGIAVSDIQTGQIDMQRYTLNGIKEIRLQIGDGTDIFISARNAALPSLIEIETETAGNNRSRLDAGITTGAWGYTSPSIGFSKNFGKLTLSAAADYTYAENDYSFTIYNITQRIHKRRTHSMMNQGHGEVSASYRFNDRHFLSMKSYFYDNDRQLPGIVRYYTSASEQQLRERNHFTQFHYRGDFNRKWSMKAAAKWNRATSDYTDGLFPENKMDAYYRQREGYLSAAAQWKPQEGLAVCYASDYIHNALSSHTKMILNSRPTRNTFLNTVSARWNRDFLSAAVRLLHSAYINDTEVGSSGRDYHRWTPSACLSVRPAEGLNLRFMWKKIFRMPSFNELYYYHLGASELRPEQTDQYNLGLTLNKRLGRRVELSASIDGYIGNVRDKIVSVPVDLFLWQNINAAKVKTKGVDFTASADITLNPRHSLSLNAHYSYTGATDRSARSSVLYGKQIAYTPHNTFSFTACWRNPWVNFSLDTNGQSRRWATNAHTAGTDIPGYAEVGATLFRHFRLRGGQRLFASFSLTNILNKQYELIAHYPMPGRGWRTSLRYSF